MLFCSWKKNIKTLLLWKKLINFTNVHVETSHVEVEVLDKYMNQILQALGIHHMGCNSISNLQNPAQGGWELTGQSPDHHIQNVENLFLKEFGFFSLWENKNLRSWMVIGDSETAMKKIEINSALCSLWERQVTILNCKRRFKLWKILSTKTDKLLQLPTLTYLSVSWIN